MLFEPLHFTPCIIAAARVWLVPCRNFSNFSQKKLQQLSISFATHLPDPMKLVRPSPKPQNPAGKCSRQPSPSIRIQPYVPYHVHNHILLGCHRNKQGTSTQSKQPLDDLRPPPPRLQNPNNTATNPLPWNQNPKRISPLTTVGRFCGWQSCSAIISVSG